MKSSHEENIVKVLFLRFVSLMLGSHYRVSSPSNNLGCGPDLNRADWS